MQIQIQGLQNEYLKLEYDCIQHSVKSTEVREIYLIRTLPRFSASLNKQLDNLRTTITQSQTEITSCLDRLTAFLADLKATCEEITSKMSDLKPNHSNSLNSFGVGLTAFVKWAKENAIIAYDAPDSNRMDVWMKEVSGKVVVTLDTLMNAFDAGDTGLATETSCSLKLIPPQMSSSGLLKIKGGAKDYHYQSHQLHSASLSSSSDEGDDSVEKKSPLKQQSSRRSFSKGMRFKFQRDGDGKYTGVGGGGGNSNNGSQQYLQRQLSANVSRKQLKSEEELADESSVVSAIRSLRGIVRTDQAQFDGGAIRDDTTLKSNELFPSRSSGQLPLVTKNLSVATTAKRSSEGGVDELPKSSFFSRRSLLSPELKLKEQKYQIGNNGTLDTDGTDEEPDEEDREDDAELMRVEDQEEKYYEKKQQQQQKLSSYSHLNHKFKPIVKENKYEEDNGGFDIGVKQYSRDDLRRIEEDLKRKKMEMKIERERTIREIERGMHAVAAAAATASTGDSPKQYQPISQKLHTQQLWKPQPHHPFSSSSQSPPFYPTPSAAIASNDHSLQFSSVFDSPLSWRSKSQLSQQTLQNKHRKFSPKVSIMFKKNDEMSLKSTIRIGGAMNATHSVKNNGMSFIARQHQSEERNTDRGIISNGYPSSPSLQLLEKITSKKHEPKVVMGLLKMRMSDTLAFLKQNGAAPVGGGGQYSSSSQPQSIQSQLKQQHHHSQSMKKSQSNKSMTNLQNNHSMKSHHLQQSVMTTTNNHNTDELSIVNTMKILPNILSTSPLRQTKSKKHGIGSVGRSSWQSLLESTQSSQANQLEKGRSSLMSLFGGDDRGIQGKAATKLKLKTDSAVAADQNKSQTQKNRKESNNLDHFLLEPWDVNHERSNSNNNNNNKG